MTEVCDAEINDRIWKSKFYRENENEDFGANYDASVPEPVFLAQAVCISDQITIPYTSYTLAKSSFGLFVVVIDFAVILTIIIFIYIVEARQQDFIKAFKSNTIQMNDFTIRVKNLPRDEIYGGKEEILRAMLWDHFTKLLLEEESGLIGDSKTDLLRVPPNCEIADITFGKIT